MTINLPIKVRKAIYIVSAVASPTMVYLNSEAVVSDFSFGLFTVIMGAVAGLAALNTPLRD